MIFVITLQQLQ